MEFLRSFLRCHLAGKPVVASTNVGCFLGLKLIQMSLGAGAYKMEGPIAQKGNFALEVTMANKRAPTTRHRHTERIQWNTYQNPYLPIRGWEKWEQNRQISQSVTSNDPQRSKAKQSKAEICQHMSALKDHMATPHRRACLGLNRRPAGVVSRLTLPKLQFSNI